MTTAPTPEAICELAAEAARLLAVWDEAPVGECSQQAHAAYAAAASVRFTRGLIEAAALLERYAAALVEIAAKTDVNCDEAATVARTALQTNP